MGKPRGCAVNDVTGDPIKVKSTNDKYREGWDIVFGNPKRVQDRVDLGLSPSTVIEDYIHIDKQEEDSHGKVNES
tara:strand:- start:646 stop:870 length:225 start_codon:yes stop_codon:yes gene_type:complete